MNFFILTNSFIKKSLLKMIFKVGNLRARLKKIALRMNQNNDCECDLTAD